MRILRTAALLGVATIVTGVAIVDLPRQVARLTIKGVKKCVHYTTTLRPSDTITIGVCCLLLHHLVHHRKRYQRALNRVATA